MKNRETVHWWGYWQIINNSKPLLACPGFLSLPQWQDPSLHLSAAGGTGKRIVWNLKYLQIEQGPCVTWINRNQIELETLS